MKPSPKLVELLKFFERGPNGSFAATPYQGTADRPGVLTIGWGHVIRPGEIFDHPLSAQEADGLLYKDALSHAEPVDRLVRVKVTQDQFDALSSLVYNIGETQFKMSAVLRYLNAGEYSAAYTHFLDWKMSAGKVQPGLVRRRKSEQWLWLTGEVKEFKN